MKYTVVCSQVADHQLAEAWLKATDRQGVADAFNRIELSLKNDAQVKGQLHPSGWRVITALPLAASFHVSEDDRLVRILSVAIHS